MKKLVLFMVVCGIVSYASAVVPTSGLKLRLNADSLALSNGATVSTWTDISGNGNVATSAGTPTYVADDADLFGHASVQIQGSLTLDGYSWTGHEDDYFTLASTVHNIKTIAMVFRRTSNVYYSGGTPIFGSDGTGGWVTDEFHGDTTYGTTYWNNQADPAVRYSQMWINGVDKGTGNGEYTAVSTDYHVMTMAVQNGWGSDINIQQIAASMHTDHVWGMDVAEILVYDRYLSAEELAGVNSYLMNTYIVPEPATMALLGLGACLLRRKR